MDYKGAIFTIHGQQKGIQYRGNKKTMVKVHGQQKDNDRIRWKTKGQWWKYMGCLRAMVEAHEQQKGNGRSTWATKGQW